MIGGIILFCFILETFSIPLNDIKSDTCGYSSCPKVNPDELNVHLIAHSHDDVGWLKTVDQYYFGSKSSIQLAGVQYIIDSVIRALLKNPERKFIQVETAFLSKWWEEQDSKRRADVHKLIRNGQFEIIGGAWTMNDEAAVHYQSVIDQFTFGLKYLEDTFGECARPKIGWQIDPFGHTREMASIFAQMGFDALFFARLDWRDKSERLRTRTGEMLWRGSPNLGSNSALFTHVMYNHYSPPPGFYFDVLSEDDPLIPDKRSSEYNMDNKIEEFTKYVSEQASRYTSNNIMIAMGNDFTYQDAHFNYKNLDILINAYKELEQKDSLGRRIRLFYSTPSCYTKAVNDAAKLKRIGYKIKTDDFIPYASDYHTYWSGYYTSRPTQKRFERQGNNLLQIVKQITAFSGSNITNLDKNLDELRSAMGVMQHHDAITGTEKQPVADDYARIMMKAFDKTYKNINDVILKLLTKPNKEIDLKLEPCLLANVSHCEPSQAKQFVVAIYNPLSRKVNYHVKIPVNSDSFSITDFIGTTVEWQITPSIDSFKNVPNIKPSKFDLVFLAQDLPPLGVKLYKIENKRFGETPEDIKPDITEDRFMLGDKKNGFELSSYTGYMVYATLNSRKISMKQELMYYLGSQNNNMVFKNRSSGAYIFRPDPTDGEAKPFTDNLLKDLKVYKGKLLDEVHQTFNEWNKQIIRIYKNGENHIEFDWLVGPIDIEDKKGKEVISRFTSNGLLNTEFYTDSNGREMLRRRNNFRATYNFSNEEPIASNYYPVTSSISLLDPKKALEVAILNDRVQGGASLEQGQIELMVHRRLLRDDAFGVGEALNELEFGEGLVARGQHYLTLGSSEKSDPEYTRLKTRDIAQRKLLAPWVFMAKVENFENLQDKLNSESAGLANDLQKEVQILTLEPWRNQTVLLRLEHILEVSEGGKQTSVNLKGLFKHFEITDMYETTLAGNQKLEENHRLEWMADGCFPSLEVCTSNEIPEKDSNKLDIEKILLAPMQIRTFVAKIKANNF